MVFGAPKQLAELHGRPLLEHSIAAMNAADELEQVVVAKATIVAKRFRRGAELAAAQADNRDPQVAQLPITYAAAG